MPVVGDAMTTQTDSCKCGNQRWLMLDGNLQCDRCAYPLARITDLNRQLTEARDALKTEHHMHSVTTAERLTAERQLAEARAENKASDVAGGNICKILGTWYDKIESLEAQLKKARTEV